MANVWISSDLHFYHKRIIDFCHTTRPYDTVEDMNDGLVEIINNTVKANDTFYILGDVSFGNREQTEHILRKLPGQKYLVYGNHDRQLRETWASMYFGHRCDLLKHKLFGQEVVMCHYPLRRWEKCHYGSLHVHGHEHGVDIGVEGRCMDVGWDAHGKILNMEDVVATLSSKEILTHHGVIRTEETK